MFGQTDSKDIPKAYMRTLTETAYFHDWYLKDMYVANTGKLIHEKSKKGLLTVQLEMCTGNNDIGYLVMFIGVKKFQVLMEYSPSDVSKCAFSSFGRCYEYIITQRQQEHKHEFIFEGDARIQIVCDKVKAKKIHNTYLI